MTVHAFQGPGAESEGDASLLADLREEFAAPDAEELVTVPVLGRPNWAVVFSTNVPYEQVRAAQRAASSKSDGIDAVKLAAVLLANASRQVLRNGQPVVLRGDELTLASPDLLDITDSTDKISAIRRFYGKDGHVTATAEELIREAGYGAEVRSDPTKS